MEITQDSIQSVKEADMQVTGVIRRMTPATTLQMIREQINPLDMNLDELEEYLNEQDKDTGSDAEKFLPICISSIRAMQLQRMKEKHILVSTVFSAR